MGGKAKGERGVWERAGTWRVRGGTCSSACYISATPLRANFVFHVVRSSFISMGVVSPVFEVMVRGLGSRLLFAGCFCSGELT